MFFTQKANNGCEIGPSVDNYTSLEKPPVFTKEVLNQPTLTFDRPDNQVKKHNVG